MRFDTALAIVTNEAEAAIKKWAKFNSCHEGYAVILEEVDEIWGAVRMKKDGIDEKGRTRIEALREETVQTAAMCLRFLVDLIPEEAIT